MCIRDSPTAPPDIIYKDRFEEVRTERIDATDDTEESIDPIARRGLVVGGQADFEYGKTGRRSGMGTFDDGALILEKYVQYEVLEEDREEPRITVLSLNEHTANVDASPDLDLNNIKFGLRLVYVPELSEQLSLRDPRLASISARGAPSVFLRNHDADRTDAWKVKSNDLRTFRVVEGFDGIPQRDTSVGALITGWQDATASGYRVIHPLPLVSVTISAAESDSTTAYEEVLIDKMIEDDRFKLLFEHCFPLQKILSIMTIYTEVVFSSIDPVRLTSILGQTKDTLKTIFESAKNMNNFSYRDRNTESVGGNPGLHRGTVDGRFVGIRRLFSDGRSKVVYDEESASFVYDNELERRP